MDNDAAVQESRAYLKVRLHNSLNCSLRATNIQDVQSPLEGSAMNTRDPLAGVVSRGAVCTAPWLNRVRTVVQKGQKGVAY